MKLLNASGIQGRCTHQARTTPGTKSRTRWPIHSAFVLSKHIQMKIMRKRLRYWKGSSSPEGVRTHFGVYLHHLPSRLPTGDRLSSKNQNIPKSQFLASAPDSIPLSWTKGFVFYSLQA